MNDFNEKNASPEELLDWFSLEYKSQNFISRYLLKNLFKTIGKIDDHLTISAKLLEVGCGTGFSSLMIRDMLPNYYFEVSEVNQVYIDKMMESNFP
ncbi:MAG TPA: hypothetical protein VF338_06355, partial [Leptolinea sp.]